MSKRIELIKKRSDVLKKIRTFFHERDLIEVDTPLLSHAASVDLNLDSFITDYEVNEKSLFKLYLQTSPEFHMKQLLAENSGAIFQISKAFRNGESGKWHNPEFSILEWYRPGFSMFELMDEVESLVSLLNGKINIEKLTYQELFIKYLETDPFKSSEENLRSLAGNLYGENDFSLYNRMELQDFLMSHYIEDKLKSTKTNCFVYNYPKEQAVLARLNKDGLTSARFELYLGGIEICNGFDELINPVEQEERFKKDILQRMESSRKILPYSHQLIKALKSGLPACSGVAIGLDRLCAFLFNEDGLEDIISFTIDNA